jgi:putative nucleotidyltransferase with HDIG domain
VKYNWKDRLRNYGVLQRAIAFALTTLVIYVFLPKDILFQYEYQENQPWKHDKLYAPFEFGIRKTTAELEKERTLVAKKQPIVFNYIDDIDRAIFTQIEMELQDAGADTLCVEHMTKFEKSFFSVMSQGLIDRSGAPKNINEKPNVGLMFQNEMVTKPAGQMLTIQKAINQVTAKLVELDPVCKGTMLAALTKHIRANAVFNDSLTEKILNQAQFEVLEMEGRIEKGEAIIDRGDIVTVSKFKILESLKSEFSERTISVTGVQWSIVAQVGIALILLGLLMLFVYLNQERLFNDPRPITLALSLVSVLFAMCSLAYSSAEISIYVIPIGIAPLLLRMFFDFKLSLFTFIVLVLIIGLFTSNPLEFILIQVSAISFATLYQSSNTRRSRMLGTALLVFAGYSVIYVLVSVAQNGNISGIESTVFGWFAINALLCTLVFPLIYIVEKVFGYISETTLLELGDSNQPLLKQLAMKAPGTFQHSLQVANLAEKIASRIGGNSVLIRTAALYHDIGKMNEPQFFIENQLPDNNPHDDLEPEESAHIILDHVSKGIELARRSDLPFDIIQFIRTHHGTSTVRFFMKKAMEKLGEENVRKEDYTYPGPKPKTKEQAILMMADSVEAASRSLKVYDHESLDKLVDGIINYQLAEGQFEEAPITFKDLSEAKTSLKNSLRGIYHQRISYN